MQQEQKLKVKTIFESSRVVSVFLKRIKEVAKTLVKSCCVDDSEVFQKNKKICEHRIIFCLSVDANKYFGAKIL